MSRATRQELLIEKSFRRASYEDNKLQLEEARCDKQSASDQLEASKRSLAEVASELRGLKIRLLGAKAGLEIALQGFLLKDGVALVEEAIRNQDEFRHRLEARIATQAQILNAQTERLRRLELDACRLSDSLKAIEELCCQAEKSEVVFVTRLPRACHSSRR